jgi:hypothetical protein
MGGWVQGREGSGSPSKCRNYFFFFIVPCMRKIFSKSARGLIFTRRRACDDKLDKEALKDCEGVVCVYVCGGGVDKLNKSKHGGSVDTAREE